MNRALAAVARYATVLVEVFDELDADSFIEDGVWVFALFLLLADSAVLARTHPDAFSAPGAHALLVLGSYALLLYLGIAALAGLASAYTEHHNRRQLAADGGER